MAFLSSSSRMLSRSWFWSRLVAHTHRMSTTSKPVIPPRKIQNPPFPSSSPCLMLPPFFDEHTRNIDYKFYNLAEDRFLTLPHVKLQKLKKLMPKKLHDVRICGSSHGWVALFNPHSFKVFIYNPISLRHIELPSTRDISCVTKLILSCSPDEDELNCRAVIMCNTQNEVAFCCPGHSKEWTSIGNTFLILALFKGNKIGGCYRDIVYSRRQNLFFCLNDCSELETWDLTDLSSPRLIKTIDTDGEDYYIHNREFAGKLEYLVVMDGLFSEGEDVVLLVTRYYIEVAPDGSFVEAPPSRNSASMTIGFYIQVYNQKKDELHGDLASLGDFVLFIGNSSDSFALSAVQFPELKSNSIYFTDGYMENSEFKPNWICYRSAELFGGHDIGIFDFENETVSPCYYPCDRPNLQRIQPSPIWFFPKLAGSNV